MLTLTGSGHKPPANQSGGGHRAGMYGDTNTHAKETGLNLSGSVIPYGAAVSNTGQTNERAVLPITAVAAASGFRGIVFRRDTITAGKAGEDNGAEMAIVRKGTMYVEIGGNVSISDQVALPIGGTGAVFEASTGANIDIPGATFMQAGTAGDVVKISLS